MRGIRRISLLAVFAVLLVSSAALADDPFADYRIPDHNWKSWLADVSGFANHQHFEDTTAGLQTSGSMFGTGRMKLTGGYDSETFGHQYSIGASLDGRRDYTSQQEQDPGLIRDLIQRSQRANESFTGQLAVDLLPWRTPIGFTASTGAQLNMNQFWSSTGNTLTSPPTRQEQADNSTQGRYAVFANLSLSVGYGRVRDATPVYQVLILEQRLRETDAISHELSRTAREKLRRALHRGETGGVRSRPAEQIFLARTRAGAARGRRAHFWLARRMVRAAVVGATHHHRQRGAASRFFRGPADGPDDEPTPHEHGFRVLTGTVPG